MNTWKEVPEGEKWKVVWGVMWRSFIAWLALYGLTLAVLSELATMG